MTSTRTGGIASRSLPCKLRRRLAAGAAIALCTLALGGHVMTGGVVAHNAYLVAMTAEMIERPVRLAEFPQLVGAVGAALHAIDGEAAASGATRAAHTTGD